MTRYLIACRGCGARWFSECEMSAPTSRGWRWPIAPPCASCDPSATSTTVLGPLRVQHRGQKPCGANCRLSDSLRCHCSCGGAHHGDDLVTLRCGDDAEKVDIR